MKKHISKILLLVCIIAISGCQRACTGCQRDLQTSSRSYHIEQYNGGKLIGVWDFTGMLNNESHSDGFYFYQNDTLIEISGALIIKSK